MMMSVLESNTSFFHNLIFATSDFHLPTFSHVLVHLRESYLLNYFIGYLEILVCVIDVTHTMDVSTVENSLNRRPNDWNSPQSPDELVIQKRGRRKSIVWSPDLDANKRNNLLRYNICCTNLCTLASVIKVILPFCLCSSAKI